MGMLDLGTLQPQLRRGKAPVYYGVQKNINNAYIDGMSLFLYVSANPLIKVDRFGQLPLVSLIRWLMQQSTRTSRLQLSVHQL